MKATRELLISLLEKSGFSCFVPLEQRSCFDVAARKEKLLLLVKLLTNIDSIHEDQANELRSLAYSLGGTALIVGEQSKAYTLEDGVVYERYQLPTLNITTLELIISKQTLPRKRYYKGRFIAELDQPALKQKLNEVNVSELARKMNLSRRAIYQYQEGSRIDFKKAEELEQLLDTDLIKPQQVFSGSIPPPQPVLHDYLKKMKELGFYVTPVHRGFDAFASERESLLIGEEKSEQHARHKAEFMKGLGSFFDSHPVFVMEKPSREELKGVPVISKKEIRKSESAEELIDKTKKRER